MAKNFITFGEIMLRIAPEGHLRFMQAFPGNANLTFAGAEANVAVSLALLGADAAFVTALPKNDIAEVCVSTLRRYGVETGRIQWTDAGRLGIYYVESGANQRASGVVYDRAGSSVALLPAASYDWNSLLDGYRRFHVTGITPSLSREAAEATLAAVTAAKRLGLDVSLDLNFRKKLWKWDDSVPPKKLAERTMRGILPFVDTLIANESDCADVLGIVAENSDAELGRLDISRYPKVAERVIEQFPNLRRVAITLRESHSATHNDWGGLLYDAASKRAYFAPTAPDGTYRPYEIRAIVDRIGGGDSFGAGLLYALASEKYAAPEDAIRFASAASCLAHSIYGDFNFVKLGEVETLMAGDATGRVRR